MAIDKFSKDRFEAALPVHKETGKPLWHDVGFNGGEFVYGINIWKDGVKKVDGTIPWITIFIRSSVGMDGYAKDTGKDSIRMYFMREGKPHGSKLSNYVTRVNGWEDRMTDQLRILYKRALNLNACKVCGKPKAIFKKQKDKKLFQACPEHFNVTYEDYEEK